MEGLQENKKMMNPAKKEKIKRLAIDLLPIVALGVLFLVYVILLGAKDYSISKNLEVLLNKTIILVLVATGAIFIFTLGSFDISLGASTLFSATVGILVFNATGNVFLMFLVCLLVAIACSLLNAVIASVFHIPLFVTTIAMLSVLTSLATNIIQTNGKASSTGSVINASQQFVGKLQALDTIWFKLVVLIVFAGLCLFVFDFTKIGRRQKFLGGNPICAEMTGIKLSIYGIIAFAMAGVGVGLGASMTVIYAQTISTSTASSIGMSIFIAIVFGGMPIAGGARSKIYAAIVGGFSYMLLNSILSIMFESMQGSRDGISQIVSAVLFLVIVYVASMNYRSKALPR